MDCVLLNSGVQSQIRLSRPEEVDLNAFHEEININFSRLVDLSVKSLPHLQAKTSLTALIFTGTLLTQVPAVIMPAYSASKAALSTYVHCLRRQNVGSSTKIIELWPPAVQRQSIRPSHPIWRNILKLSQRSFTTTWVQNEVGLWDCLWPSLWRRRGPALFPRQITSSLGPLGRKNHS